MSQTARHLGILLVPLLVLSLSAFHSTVTVHADPTPTLSISPQHHPTLATPGDMITFSVNVSNLTPADQFYGWDILVVTNDSVIDPVSIAMGSFVQGTPTVNCVDANAAPGSLGCSPSDGLGVAHLGAYSSTGAIASGNGTLFTITYRAVAGPYTFITFLQPNGPISGGTNLFDVNGNPIPMTAVDGDYGPLPPLPLASFDFLPSQPFAGDTVVFNASSSSDPNNRPLVDYFWVFEQGSLPPTQAKGVIVSLVLKQGNWTVTLVVKNDQGVSSRATVHELFAAPRIVVDLSVLKGITVSKLDNIVPGTPVNITVYVSNLGTTTETHFNVSVTVGGVGETRLGYNGTSVPFAPPYPHAISPNAQATFVFTLNTTGLPPDSYTIHAHVDPLVNETNTGNNDAFLTIRLIYPNQGGLIPFGMFQSGGLLILALAAVGLVVSAVRRVQNKRYLARRDLL